MKLFIFCISDFTSTSGFFLHWLNFLYNILFWILLIIFFNKWLYTSFLLSLSSNLIFLFFQSLKNCLKFAFKFLFLNNKNLLAESCLLFLSNFSFIALIGNWICFFLALFSKFSNPFLIFNKSLYFGISAFNLLNPSLTLFLLIFEFIWFIFLINSSFLKSSNFCWVVLIRHLFK